MPVWYAEMKPFIDSGQISLLGVIQEQHAERCRLFQQWKTLDFPVVQDALNSNGITEVPVYVAIDEHGIVRARPRRPSGFAEDFIERRFDSPDVVPGRVDRSDTLIETWRNRRQNSDSAANRSGLADSLVLWQGDRAAVGEAVDLYTQVAQQDPGRAVVYFRRGVARRRLYELTDRHDAAYFEGAVADWEAALQRNPNHYIYRRRIEQYGPRLKKPYPFYNWITQARQEIADRGETPLRLLVEPGGAELARDTGKMTIETESKNPDPQNQITRDRRFAGVHATTVPTRPGPGDVVAVHVGFSIVAPGKWNHESTPLQVWIDEVPADVQVSSRLIEDTTVHSEAESTQPLSLSFELRIPEKQTADLELNAFALFNLCESEGGQCLFRRRDFAIRVPVAAP